jgi:hypothetical protein
MGKTISIFFLKVRGSERRIYFCQQKANLRSLLHNKRINIFYIIPCTRISRLEEIWKHMDLLVGGVI